MGTNLTTTESLDELLAAYALGILEAEDCQMVEDLLARSPQARQELSALRRVVDAFALDTDPVPLPAGHNERFASKLASLTAAPAAANEERTPLPFRPSAQRDKVRPARPAWVAWSGWAVAAVLAALLMTATLWGSNQAGQAEVARAAQAQQAQQIAALKLAQVQWEEDRTHAIAVLGASDVVLHPLTATATDGLPGVVTNLWISATTNQGVLITHNLPATDPGHLYEFWLIGDAPVAAGTFQPTEKGGWLLVSSPITLASYSKAAITIEPIPGGPLPTTHPILLGNL